MQRKQRYDSHLIWLIANGRQHQVPSHLIQLIPPSTASTWRQLQQSTFIGFELSAHHLAAVDHYHLLQQHHALRRTVFTVVRLWLGLRSSVVNSQQWLRHQPASALQAVKSLSDHLRFSQVVRLLGFSASAYYNQLSRTRWSCAASPLALCFGRHPQQLALGELQVMKQLFTHPATAAWPVAAIYYHALRTGRLAYSLASFYKYAGLLGLRRPHPKPLLKTVGIRSAAPNAFLHVDTTRWQCESGVILNMAFVTDNFSRAILGYSVGLRREAALVKQALQIAIGCIAQHHPQHTTTTLVADGGSENHAATIEELLRQCPHPSITKVVAQRDICFSNSPVEAVNKAIKRYLRHYKPATPAAFNELLCWCVNDYNHQKPHTALGGLCPMESYTEPQRKLDFTQQKARATAARLADNRRQRCGVC